MGLLKLRGLRYVALIFLLPGLAGMLIGTMISIRYLENLPRMPIPEEMRMTPRNIHGVVVYQTKEEDRRLTLVEYTSTGVFVIGLGLGLVYLRRWGVAYAMSAEEDEYANYAP